NDMISLHEAYPQYNFAGHKGYPTKAHFEAIAEYGILDCYRKSFKPVKALLEEK
ncbi:MAG: ribonuclease HII, partial [Pseudomonadota bacterium]|nr:ribonuclease HII [Pseudomonadota bacterium]